MTESDERWPPLVDADLQVGRAARVARPAAPRRPRGTRPGRTSLLVFGNFASRRRIAAASTPAPQLTAKYRPSATPERSSGTPRRRAPCAIRTPVASTGSVRQAERSRQDVRGAAGDDAERGLGAGERVDGLVDRARHRRRRRQGRRLRRTACAGELVGVAALLGLDDLEPEVGRDSAFSIDRERGLGHRRGPPGSRRAGAAGSASTWQRSISGSVRSPIAPRTGGSGARLLASESGRGIGAFALHYSRTHPGDRGEPARRTGRRAPPRPRRRWRPRRDRGGTRQLAERREQPNGHAGHRPEALSPPRPGPLCTPRGAVIRVDDAHRSPRRRRCSRRPDAAARAQDRAPVGRGGGRGAGARAACAGGRRRRTPVRGTRCSARSANASPDPAPRRDRTPGRRALPLERSRTRSCSPALRRARSVCGSRSPRRRTGAGEERRSGSGRSRWTPAPTGSASTAAPLDLTFKEFELLRFLAQNAEPRLHPAGPAAGGLGLRLLRRDADGRRPRPCRLRREARSRLRGETVRRRLPAPRMCEPHRPFGGPSARGRSTRERDRRARPAARIARGRRLSAAPTQATAAFLASPAGRRARSITWRAGCCSPPR